MAGGHAPAPLQGPLVAGGEAGLPEAYPPIFFQIFGIILLDKEFLFTLTIATCKLLIIRKYQRRRKQCLKISCWRWL